MNFQINNLFNLEFQFCEYWQIFKIIKFQAAQRDASYQDVNNSLESKRFSTKSAVHFKQFDSHKQINTYYQKKWKELQVIIQIFDPWSFSSKLASISCCLSNILLLILQLILHNGNGYLALMISSKLQQKKTQHFSTLRLLLS